MFYFAQYNKQKILKSDFIQDIDAFFTLREGFNFDSLSASRIITPVQTHSDNVQIVDERFEYPECDGIITNRKNEAVYLRFADCTPLIFYDSKKRVAAVSHAGWRGTYQKIGVKTADKMVNVFGCNPEDITVLIGPAISLCCYEVGDDVKEKLLSTVNDNNGLYKNNNVDLKQINARQLQEFGVKRIDVCPYCTCCNNDLFFSYRKENGTKMRHHAVIKL